MSRRSSLARVASGLLLSSASVVFAAGGKPLATVAGQTVSAADLALRLSKLPDFQRAALASDPQSLKRAVLTALLLPDLMYAAEAERLKLSERPELRERQRAILQGAMDRELFAESARQMPLGEAEIKAYFEANRARFETPRRIRIWRILTDDEALAEKIITDCQGVDGLKRWSEYAREKSLDRATQFRDGDLGFVHPDGKTDTPTLRVDSALFAGAEALSDGQLSKVPIREGAHFAVLWRRGSAAALSRTWVQERGAISQVLERERVQKLRRSLLDELSRKYLSGLNEGLLETVKFDAQGLATRDNREREPRLPAAGSSAPSRTDRGTR